MDEIAVKPAYSPEELAQLRSQLADFKRLNGFSWHTLGNRVDVARSTVERWAAGKYSSHPDDEPNQKVGRQIARFFASEDSQRKLDDDAAIRPEFQMTETARLVQSVCRWSQRGYMTIVVGDPGVGKTEALRNFQVNTPNVWMATFSPTSRSVSGMLLTLLAEMGGSDRKGGGRHQLSRLVREQVRGRRGLLICDEAQHVDSLALEELRAIRDETGVGLLLSGNREVLTRAGGSGGAAFAQLHSRVSMRHIFDKPRPADVEVMLEAWCVEDRLERDLLTRIAMRPGGGALRSLTHALELATIIAQQDRAPRGLEHIKEAWTQLSSRPAA